MQPLPKQILMFLTSMKLTVVLLAFSMVLVFVATLAQVDLGIWAVQEKYFRSFFVMGQIRGTGVTIPILPGGYLVGGLLFLNLTAAHIHRFKLAWSKAGLILTHFGLILLLVGELISGLLQRDSMMRLDEGETKNYSETIRSGELAVIDTTAPDVDWVVAIPETLLTEKSVIQNAKLPFRIEVRQFLPNSQLFMRSQAPNAPASGATQGLGTQAVIQQLPVSYKPDDQNLPSALIELIGPEGSLGTWLVSRWMTQTQEVSVAGRTFQMIYRGERAYYPFSIQLLKFTHDRYPGTNIPKNFASLVRLSTQDASENREVNIFMNNPLRTHGLTFYQAGFENNDTTSILQVVRNPSWAIPYIACIVMWFGLSVHFLISFTTFLSKRSAA